MAGRDAASSAPRRKAAIQRGFDIAPIGYVLGKDGLNARTLRRFEEVREIVEGGMLSIVLNCTHAHTHILGLLPLPCIVL